MDKHILTGHFYPQSNQRAIRTSKLAPDFKRLDYEVVRFYLTEIEGFNYDL